MKELISRSTENNEKMIIFYLDSKNRVTERSIRVIRLHDHYMLAYCFYRKQVRTFKYENILSAGPIRKGASA